MIIAIFILASVVFMTIPLLDKYSKVRRVFEVLTIPAIVTSGRKLLMLSYSVGWGTAIIVLTIYVVILYFLSSWITPFVQGMINRYR